MTSDAVLIALGIFLLRVINNTLGTVRLVMITRQQRMLAAGIGFFEALIFAITMAGVVADLTNILNLFAYCAGFSVGGYLGMSLESRFITSFMTVNVITQENGHAIACAIRDAGYGVTETVGEGRDGKVTMIRSVVTNREVPKILHIVHKTYPDAFVSVEQARAVMRGYVGGSRSLSQN